MADFDLSQFDTSALIIERPGGFLIDTEARLLERGATPQEIEIAKIKLSKRKMKNNVRDEVANTVGDPLSMIGYVSDGAMLALYGLAKVIKAIDTYDTLAEVRAELVTIKPVVDDFLTKIESGEQKLPALEKGVDVVIPEVLDKMNKTAIAWSNNQ
jgi:tRNA A37 methylthiotransferase MiaB